MIKAALLLILAVLPSFQVAAELAIPANPEVIRSMVAHNDNIWVGAFGLGLWQIGPAGVAQIKVPHPMISLMKSHDNKLWVATAGGGCYYLESDKNPAVELPVNDGFAKLHAMFLNENQSLLVGSVGNGSAMLIKDGWHPLEASSTSARRWVNSITLFSNRILIGTSTGVYHTEYPATADNWHPVKLNGIKGTNHLLVDKDKLFAATTSDGIYEINPQFEAKQVEDSFGQTHFVAKFNNQVIAGGKYCLWLIDQGRAHHLEGYNFSEPKCAVSTGNKILIGTMKGEIISSNDLKEFKKSYEFCQNKLEEVFE